jgi:hypothetical protein
MWGCVSNPGCVLPRRVPQVGSPSANIFIDPAGAVTLLSTHEKVRPPALRMLSSPRYAPAVRG